MSQTFLQISNIKTVSLFLMSVQYFFGSNSLNRYSSITNLGCHYIFTNAEMKFLFFQLTAILGKYRKYDYKSKGM